ncbi:MAG: hypothetical protein EOM18_09050, partial [Clostridia bacterium]|nr:hypothetical protein [Clostridia bacterium]
MMVKESIISGWQMRKSGDPNWSEAVVPGTVYTDLLRNEQMENPFWKDNENKALKLMEDDYEYETVFDSAAVAGCENVWLRFE